MGDELHVQRLGDGDDTEEIAEAEWLEFVRESPDFVLQDELSTPSPTGERITMGGQGLAGWNGHPNVELVPFRWSHGVVTVSFGDEYAVVGALVVADALGATVVGDDGERYDEPHGI